MKLKFFHIPALHPQAAEQELNQFLAAHRISRVDKAFVPDGGASAWSVAVTWTEGAEPSAAGQAGAARIRGIDYKEVLSPPEFGVYDRLRNLCKQLATAEGLPPWALVSNERLR